MYSSLKIKKFCGRHCDPKNFKHVFTENSNTKSKECTGNERTLCLGFWEIITTMLSKLFPHSDPVVSLTLSQTYIYR